MVTPQVNCIPHLLEVAIPCHLLRDLDKMFRELTEQPEMVIKTTGTGLVLSWGLILALQVLKTPRNSVLRFWTWGRDGFLAAAMLWVLGGRVGVVEEGKAAVAPTTFQQVNHLFSTGLGLQGFLSLHTFPNLRNPGHRGDEGLGCPPTGMCWDGAPWCP